VEILSEQARLKQNFIDKKQEFQYFIPPVLSRNFEQSSFSQR
jgi:hypothetical protein